MSNIILFESKNVRRVWNDEEQKWYFSVQDVVEILTDSADIKQYGQKIHRNVLRCRVCPGALSEAQ